MEAMRATPPSLRISEGTRSSAITAQAPAFSAIRACSTLVTSMMTPPFSISAKPTFKRNSSERYMSSYQYGRFWAGISNGLRRGQLPVLKSVILSVVMRRLLVLLFVLLLAGGLFAQKRKKKPDEEPRPQVLEVLPEPPEAVVADSGRLSFQVSPLSDKGLLSQQVRDALKALARLNHGGVDRQSARVRRRIGRFAAYQRHRGGGVHREETDAPGGQHYSGGRAAAAGRAGGDRSDFVGKESGESERGGLRLGWRKRERGGCRRESCRVL